MDVFKRRTPFCLLLFCIFFNCSGILIKDSIFMYKHKQCGLEFVNVLEMYIYITPHPAIY